IALVHQNRDTAKADLTFVNDNMLRVHAINGVQPMLEHRLTRQADLDPIDEPKDRPALNCCSDTPTTPGYQGARPPGASRRCASSTALRTCIFWRMRARCAAIVRCETPSSAAIPLLGLPVATYVITSRSRGVSTATRLSLNPDRMKSLI